MEKWQKKALNQLMTEAGLKEKGRVYNEINEKGLSYDEALNLVGRLRYEQEQSRAPVLRLDDLPHYYKIFGKHLIAQNAIEDMNHLMRMPYAKLGAQMSDSHRVSENEMPVGGVIATKNYIVPKFVGSDISCSVLLSGTTVKVTPKWFTKNLESLKYVLRKFAMFGAEINSTREIYEQEFFNKEVFLHTQIGRETYARIRDIAVTHFRTSGDGNHFAEWGMIDVVPIGWHKKGAELIPATAMQLALLTHFGSRAVGSTIASVFEKEAAALYTLTKGITAAPLDINTDLGQDYLTLMNWAGDFTEAGHRALHVKLFKELEERVEQSLDIAFDIYSRHNFAWREYINSEEFIVHRKGATPANKGQYAVIPATMGNNTQIVLGLGNEDALNSAPHGSGRRYSRGAALQQFKGTQEYVLKEYGVTLIGGGEDEDPRAYKDITEVIEAQKDCSISIGEFVPKVVRMADPRFVR